MREVQIATQFLLTLHRRFDNATQVLFCDSNWYKLEHKRNLITSTYLIRKPLPTQLGLGAKAGREGLGYIHGVYVNSHVLDEGL